MQRRLQSGEITVDAAAAAEEKIVELHRQAADAILAKEQELARQGTALWQEIANKRAELEQQTQDKLAAIKDKAAAEDKARAERIDSELAGGLSSAIMGALEGKESIGQALQKIVQGEEKVLEGSIKQLLDASGIGEGIDKAEQGLLGFLPGAKKTETTGPDHLTAALQKTTPEVARLGDAAAGAAAKLSGSASPAAGAGPLPPGGEKYATQITGAAAKYGVPEPILYNLLGAESSFNPQAGPSSAGARGIAQFIPSTASRYNVDVTSAQSSIEGAAHYLSDLYAAHGNWAGALGEYSNQGPALATYAAEKNAYGPALVAAARQADQGTGGATPGTAAALELPEVPHYPALAEGGSVEETGLATVHAGEDVVPAGFWAQIGADISDFLARPHCPALPRVRAAGRSRRHPPPQCCRPILAAAAALPRRLAPADPAPCTPPPAPRSASRTISPPLTGTTCAGC